ncbi:MAG: M48 family metallopeptidase [Bryobacteraceae bacterium]|nr:M48 family metallopeptidase [Bryobacteraceae bacterium]
MSFYIGAIVCSLTPLVCAAIATTLPLAELILFGPWLAAIAAGAGLIAWAVVPRKSPSALDGIPLNPAQQPALAAFLEEVAQRTGQPLPSLVLLTADARTATGFYSGFAGIGSQRVLSIGLPYFAVLEREELAALMAHELGHFYQGSMFAWAWIVETQRAVARLFGALERWAPRLIPVFQLIFEPFVRACLAASRRQEFAADRFAAGYYGSDVVQSVLAKNQRLAFEFHIFFESEMLPLLRGGWAPPLLSGFHDFSRRFRPGTVLNFLSEVPVELMHQPDAASSDEAAFDTHPSVQTRIEAVDQQPDATGIQSHPSLALLLDVEELEGRLMAWEARKRGLPALQPLAWNQVLPRFYRPRWEVAAEGHGFDGQTVAQLPQIIDSAGVELVGAQFANGVRERLQHIAETLCAALERDGWQAELRAPGGPIVMRKADRAVEPFTVISRLAWKQIAFFEWEDECAELGIANLVLVAPTLQRA